MRRHAFALGAFFAVLHADTACSDEDPTTPGTTPIDVGSLVAQTGDLSLPKAASSAARSS